MIKNMPDAIINLPTGIEFSNQKPIFEVIIKKNKKVIYHNKAYAMVCNMVQSVTTFQEIKGDVELEGDSQVFGAGDPVIQLFALNELQRKMKKVGVITHAMMKLQQMIKDPETFKKMAEQIRKMVEHG